MIEISECVGGPADGKIIAMVDGAPRDVVGFVPAGERHIYRYYQIGPNGNGPVYAYEGMHERKERSA